MTGRGGAGLAMVVLLMCGACAIGPDYRRPAVAVPPAFKEQAPADDTVNGEWQRAQPRDDVIRAHWWESFDDPILARLEEQAVAANQTLARAEAAFRGARAAVHGARAELFPSVSAGVAATRSRLSTNRVAGAASGARTDVQLPVDFSYEADVWGRVRRGVEGSVASAQASSADVETARLSITAELALDYVELRGLDTQATLLDETVAAYGRALELTRARFAQGVASGIDVAQAETQLDAARVQATDLRVARAQLEHAIATLTGAPPAALTIDRSAAVPVPPAIPVGLPSRLLERRPDIAAAERRVASANAAIGAARAAFFPALLLSGGGGFESSTVASLLSLPSRFWSLGPSLVETIVDGGRRRAIADQAIAAHEESVAAYRQSVLTAFQEVEDTLVALRVLADEARQAAGAVDSASRSLDLANQQFAAGVASYLPVVTAQTAVLSARLTAVDIQTRQLTSSVLLVKALGGGWSTAQLPDERELRRSTPKREAP